MERIDFPQDEETIVFVEGLGLDPDDLAKRLFEAEVHRLKAERRHERLEEAGITLPRSAADIVREERGR